MKNAMIFAKKSTWKARLDIDYLDETSQLKQRNRPKEFITGQKLRQFSDYASKETVGQVYPGGFFHFKVGQNNDGTFTSPSMLSNEERKKGRKESLKAGMTISKRLLQKEKLFNTAWSFPCQRKCTMPCLKPVSIPTAFCIEA